MTAPIDPATRLVDADRHATLARQRLSATVAGLQVRLDPTRLADRALAEVKAVGTSSATVAERNRGAIIGAGAAIGLFLARKPLLRLFRRRSSDPAATAPDPSR